MTLRVENIYKHFNGVVAVDGLSFEVRPGAITALIGPNGAGKTTVFNLVTGFAKPDRGRVSYGGKAITGLAPHRVAGMGIGRTFQAIRLFPQMSVLDNVILGMRPDGTESIVPALTRPMSMISGDAKRKERALALLDMMGLGHKQGHYAETLSYGQRRLVEIARAIAMDAGLYLLDEPTAGVYPEMINRILEYVRKLKQDGRTVLFIEHNMRVVRELADWIIVLDYGKKIKEGTPDEVFNDSEVLERYFGRRGSLAD